VKRIVFIFFLVPFILCAQKSKYANQQRDVYKGKTISLAPLTTSELRSTDNKHKPIKYAEQRAVDLTPYNSGQWINKNNTWYWTLTIESIGATSLNFGFTEYHLPSEASLVIDGMNEKYRLGPFTKADNKQHDQLWTPIIEDDYVKLSLSVPESEMNNIRLRLSSINHGLTNAFWRNNSGDCNIDVNCGLNDFLPLIDNYRDQIQSVCAVSTNGSISCTGFLINTPRNDATPYIITAAHCEVTEQTASSVIVYWNYKNSTCREVNSAINGLPGDGRLDQFSMGASVVASAENGFLNEASTDFTLLKLDNPVDPDFRPYFLGWDRRAILPDSSFVIHHPNGDEMSISFDFDQTEFTTFDGDSVFIRVLDWDIGTTENGSSGGPYFNIDGRLIGYVSGGQAACDNDLWDEFSWFGRAWTGEGSSATRLSDWLDPDNIGVEIINGYNGSFMVSLQQSNFDICATELNEITFNIRVDENFQDTVLLEAVNLPQGAEMRFESNKLLPGGTTEISISGLDNLASGEYDISIKASDGVNSNENSVFINLNANVIDNLVLNTPNGIQSPTGPIANFQWEGIAENYDLQISEDLSFTNPIVNEKELSERIYSTTILNTNHEYFWRVRGSNLCGLGTWTEAVLFRTSSLNCNNTIADDLMIELPAEGTDTFISTIDIMESGLINQINVPVIEGTHSWSGDLSFTLISPLGTEVVLADALCSSEAFADFSIGFSNDGPDHKSIPCPFTDGKFYQPKESLSAFEGEEAMGQWTLKIIDQVNFDGGQFDKWVLQICNADDQSLFSEFSSKVIDICGLDSLNSEFTLSQAFEGPVNITANASNPNIEISLGSVQANPGDIITFNLNKLSALGNEKASIQITTTDSTKISTSSIILSNDSAPQAFDLTAPINKEDQLSGPIEFNWNISQQSESYIVQITQDSSFTSVEFEMSSDQPFLTIDSEIDLIDSTLYYWRVIAKGVNCDRTSSVFKFTTDIQSATDDPTLILNVDIFPNPSSDIIYIEFNKENLEDVQAELYDLTGKVISSSVIKSYVNSATLDISDFASGVYYLRLYSDKNIYTTTIVKQ